MDTLIKSNFLYAHLFIPTTFMEFKFKNIKLKWNKY
jgi:hypothetical protein